MIKKGLVVLLALLLVLMPSTPTQAEDSKSPKPDSPKLSEPITTTTFRWEMVDTTDGPRLALVTTVAMSQSADGSIDLSRGENSLATTVTFTMERAIAYYYDWLNRPWVRARGKSTVSVVADQVYVFVWQFYGNPGNCTNGVWTAQKTEYNKKVASCSTTYTMFGHNLDHCIRNAQHHAKVWGEWMFWYDNRTGPFVYVP
jgi:hypothetical protein